MCARLNLDQWHVLTLCQHTNTDDEDLPASAKVWNTTELLEQIISYLPAADIVVLSGANKMSYNCVNNSSFAQVKLLMRPSNLEPEVWWYCQDRTLGRNRRGLCQRVRITGPSFELSGEGALLAGRVLAVALCPFLRLPNHHEATALGRIKRQRWADSNWVTLAGAPIEDTKYAHMYLTDPPTTAVSAELVYKHSQIPSMIVKAKRCVGSKTSHGFTFNEMIKRVREEPGVVSVTEPPTSLNEYRYLDNEWNDSYINHEIREKVCKYGGHFVLDSTMSIIRFPYSIVVPSAEEWLEMDAKRVRNEEQSAESQSA
jgi:hypothetical protein